MKRISRTQEKCNFHIVGYNIIRRIYETQIIIDRFYYFEYRVF